MRTSGSGFQLGVSEASLLVVKEGGLMLPLCPSGWHGLELIDAFLEPGVDHLLEAIDKAYIVGGITTRILKSSNFAILYLKNMNKTHTSELTSEGR